MVWKPERSKSIEAGIFVMGEETSRDGSITCEGSVAEPYSRRISRCARSTLAAAETAVANGIELALRHRAAVTEILSGYFLDCRPIDSDPLSL